MGKFIKLVVDLAIIPVGMPLETWVDSAMEGTIYVQRGAESEVLQLTREEYDAWYKAQG